VFSGEPSLGGINSIFLAVTFSTKFRQHQRFDSAFAPHFNKILRQVSGPSTICSHSLI
jgi:hypothetical protein